MRVRRRWCAAWNMVEKLRRQELELSSYWRLHPQGEPAQGVKLNKQDQSTPKESNIAWLLNLEMSYVLCRMQSSGVLLLVLLAGCPWPGHARAGRQSRKDVTKLGPKGRWSGGRRLTWCREELSTGQQARLSRGRPQQDNKQTHEVGSSDISYHFMFQHLQQRKNWEDDHAFQFPIPTREDAAVWIWGESGKKQSVFSLCVSCLDVATF